MKTVHVVLNPFITVRSEIVIDQDCTSGIEVHQLLGFFPLRPFHVAGPIVRVHSIHEREIVIADC
jgi:hypothetical protein